MRQFHEDSRWRAAGFIAITAYIVFLVARLRVSRIFGMAAYVVPIAIFASTFALGPMVRGQLRRLSPNTRRWLTVFTWVVLLTFYVILIGTNLIL